MLLVSHDRELLRTLTTRVWVLHERHITDFDGNFAEWEIGVDRATARGIGARRRGRSAPSRAGEEEDGAARRSRRDDREARAAQRAAASVPISRRRSRRSKSQIEDVTHELEDPELYTQAERRRAREGARRRPGRLKRELERALDEWGTATDALDTLTAGRA